MRTHRPPRWAQGLKTSSTVRTLSLADNCLRAAGGLVVAGTSWLASRDSGAHATRTRDLTSGSAARALADVARPVGEPHRLGRRRGGIPGAHPRVLRHARVFIAPLAAGASPLSSAADTVHEGQQHNGWGRSGRASRLLLWQRGAVTLPRRSRRARARCGRVVCAVAHVAGRVVQRARKPGRAGACELMAARSARARWLRVGTGRHPVALSVASSPQRKVEQHRRAGRERSGEGPKGAARVPRAAPPRGREPAVRS